MPAGHGLRHEYTIVALGLASALLDHGVTAGDVAAIVAEQNRPDGRRV